MNSVVLVKKNAAMTIRTIMENEDISQTKLASLCDINRQAVQQSLNRKSGDMRMSTFTKMIRAMGYVLQAVKIS